jgi:hypothetical protein
MAAGDSLDSQMPDALSGWLMVYPILIVGLAAALPRDGAQRQGSIEAAFACATRVTADVATILDHA